MENAYKDIVTLAKKLSNQDISLNLLRIKMVQQVAVRSSSLSSTSLSSAVRFATLCDFAVILKLAIGVFLVERRYHT
jgi:hypothetical protein